MRQKHEVRYSMRFPSISMLISRHRNPVFSPSDRNTFFFFVSPDSPNVVISFWDYDAVGEREEIGHAVLSFHRLLYSGDICPSEIISLPIVTHKPKTAPVRGYVDLRYGLVSRRPPLPAAELLARAASQQLSPFSSYLQRMIRFLQVQSRSTSAHTTLSFLACFPPLTLSISSFSEIRSPVAFLRP
jgi:hypothetical protein